MAGPMSENAARPTVVTRPPVWVRKASSRVATCASRAIDPALRLERVVRIDVMIRRDDLENPRLSQLAARR